MVVFLCLPLCGSAMNWRHVLGVTLDGWMDGWIEFIWYQNLTKGSKDPLLLKLHFDLFYFIHWNLHAL